MSLFTVDRRTFLRLTATASAGLVLGVAYGAPKKNGSSGNHDLGTFVQIDTDGIVTIWVTKSEMGQGVRTALPMIVAEELDADWSRVRVRQAHFDAKFGRMGTGGSGSVRTMWQPLREAGASARAMLVAAAAAKLGVDASALTVRDGVITHAASGRKLGFGDVAEEATKVAIPKSAPLKKIDELRIIGKVTPRVDNPDVITGKAQYGLDVKVPGMLYAAVRRAPVFGGKVASFDAANAQKVAGVKHVVKVDAMGIDMPWNGVAVVASSTWAAMRGRDALSVTWDDGPGANESTESLRAAMESSLAGGPLSSVAGTAGSGAPRTFHNTGDVEVALTSAAKTIDATYEVPFLSHAPLEPMNATASVTADGAEIWAPTQFPDRVNAGVATALGLKPEQVKVNVTLLGGAFGRRINADYAIEAAIIAKAAGAPVKVTWTREDDMQHGFYRPASMHRLAGALDADGKPVAWRHAMAAPSRRAYSEPKSETLHDSESAGIADLGWVIPNVRASFANVASNVPRGAWRAVAHATNGFVIGGFLDELAHAAGKDPIDFYLSLYPAGKKVEHASAAAKDYPFEADRLRRVIETVRDQVQWSRRRPGGGSPAADAGNGSTLKALGFAAYYSFLTYTAHVAEVAIENDAIRVQRVVCAVDCGVPINPDGIRAQIEGGILYGLTAALGNQITIDKGRVQQSNFHDYPLLTMAEVPKIEVHIMPSVAPPSGTGEPGLPSTAAAVANAVFAITGKRLRKLPFTL